MASKPTPRRRTVSGSTVIAGLMVAAAGAIAWHGTGSPDTAGPPAAASAQTLAPAEGLAPASGSLAVNVEGALPTRVVVPAAGIDADVREVGVVVESGRPAWETAWRAAGHHIDSARPGQPGNVVLTGHVSVADRANLAVFKSLDRVREGDVIEVFAGDALHRYAVTAIEVVDPEATRLLRSDHRALVTLITCTPDLERRLVVTGALISS